MGPTSSMVRAKVLLLMFGQPNSLAEGMTCDQLRPAHVAVLALQVPSMAHWIGRGNLSTPQTR